MSKILIVEDNEMNRDMLSRRLMRKGFEVIMAEDGQKGVEMSITENPDLILMDLSLPIMDGWQAIPNLLILKIVFVFIQNLFMNLYQNFLKKT